MKTKTFLLILFIVYGILFGFGEISAKSLNKANSIDNSQTSEITIFTTGVKPFTNSSVVWQSVPIEFEGYKFFSTDANHVFEGKIVPSATGTIYIVASRAASIVGWTKTEYIAVYASDKVQPTTVNVFQRDVNFGDTIDIPTNNYWAGFSPLAYSITIKGQTTSNLETTKEWDDDYFFVKDKSFIFSEKLTQPLPLHIYDICGKLIFIKNRIHPGETISIDTLKKGIYITKLDLQNRTIIKKIYIN